MKWKDKSGREIGKEEFMERWKQGIMQVTPLQQNKVQIKSTILILLGIIGGIVMAIISIKTLWWLGIILVAAFFNTAMSLIALYQQKIKLTAESEGGIKHGT